MESSKRLFPWFCSGILWVKQLLIRGDTSPLLQNLLSIINFGEEEAIMDIKNINLKDIEIIKKDTHYIVKRHKNYYRIGNKEAQLLIDIIDGKNEDVLVSKHQIELSELKNFLNALEQIGIIGSIKKEKKNFLFYRVPLMNPDKILTTFNNIFLQNKIINNFILIFMMIIIIVGLIEFFINITDIAPKFLKGFGFKEYILFYLATISAVFLHELGHGVICKYYNGNVEEIGFILIFFSPALYCDVSGIWLFEKRKQKIITLLAGIIVQLIIFSIMVFLYLNFYNSSTWLATFILWNLLMTISNIIPVIKLDGYWILSNLVEIPNLYEKSMKLALGVKENVLFNEREVSKKKFIKLFGLFNIVFVFISLILGFWSIYYISKTLEGTFRTVALLVETLMYILTLIFFSAFLYKIVKSKLNNKKEIN